MTKCPKCGHRIPAGKPKSFNSLKREHLKAVRYNLSCYLNYLVFESGRAFEAAQEHRLALGAIEKTERTLDKEQKQLRLKIRMVEKQLHGCK